MCQWCQRFILLIVLTTFTTVKVVRLFAMSLKNFAGRHRVGAHYEEVVRKIGIRHERLNGLTGQTREVLSLGGACSEIFTGRRLARVLTPALELQQANHAALVGGFSSPCLSQHTSAGVPVRAVEEFLEGLSPHLPWHINKKRNEELIQGKGREEEDDWFVSLQAEGQIQN